MKRRSFLAMLGLAPVAAVLAPPAVAAEPDPAAGLIKISGGIDGALWSIEADVRQQLAGVHTNRIDLEHLIAALSV